MHVVERQQIGVFTSKNENVRIKREHHNETNMDKTRSSGTLISHSIPWLIIISFEWPLMAINWGSPW